MGTVRTPSVSSAVSGGTCLPAEDQRRVQALASPALGWVLGERTGLEVVQLHLQCLNFYEQNELIYYL